MTNLSLNSLDGKAQERRRQMRYEQEQRQALQHEQALYERWRNHMTKVHGFDEGHEDFWQVWHDEETECDWK